MGTRDDTAVVANGARAHSNRCTREGASKVIDLEIVLIREDPCPRAGCPCGRSGDTTVLPNGSAWQQQAHAAWERVSVWHASKPTIGQNDGLTAYGRQIGWLVKIGGAGFPWRPPTVMRARQSAAPRIRVKCRDRWGARGWRRLPGGPAVTHTDQVASGSSGLTGPACKEKEMVSDFLYLFSNNKEMIL
jgi:hypothetical protein